MNKLAGKPRVGQRIAFVDPDGREPDAATGTVRRVDKALCWWLPDGHADEARHHSCFIWQFGDGEHNSLVRVEYPS